MSETRVQSFEGEIKKCPNCGAVLPSMVAKCPECGFELRNAKSANSLQKFYNDLNYASDCNKPSLISSFPIPNTKEDFIEFLSMASSEISSSIASNGIFGQRLNRNLVQHMFNVKSDDEIYIAAWETKFEQTYSKAKIVLAGDASGIAQINAIYSEMIGKKKKQKGKKAKIIFLIVLGYIVVFGGLFGLPELKKGKEIKRLDNLAEKIEMEISAGNFTQAEFDLNKFVWTATSTDSDINEEYKVLSDQYKEKRQNYLDMIEKIKKEKK